MAKLHGCSGTICDLVKFETPGSMITASGSPFAAFTDNALGPMQDVEVEVNGRRYRAAIRESVAKAPSGSMIAGTVWSM